MLNKFFLHNISFIKKYKFYTFKNFLFLLNIIFVIKKFKKKIFFFFNIKKNTFFYIFNFKKQKKILKKKSKFGRLKEIRMKINIDINDFKLKIKKTNIFLLEGYNIKVTIVFRGREIIYKEKGIELILKLQNEIKGVYFKFSDIELDGKYLFSYFIPKHDKNKKKKINKKKIIN
ncbi:translation initiation factor IF-3 [Candidatus Carsonella ruddii]|uniref:Translation initiation factor IF-3 n=1 Tax=Candidatus Carsonella ruddii PC isolate NHV TaxID=1202540 RepID=J3Z232_CARRU|nr:translation initiation factor IF-3 C-terminal domain-containing protein [Candidatus Carsonella ruddii]AFP84319.1 translation initiation factor IF-3 [Candidatus Carsonella ruddii PC isolate NHV]